MQIESPVRRKQGELFDFDMMQKVCALARERQIGLHLDGARIFLASGYTGISPARYAASNARRTNSRPLAGCVVHGMTSAPTHR